MPFSSSGKDTTFSSLLRRFESDKGYFSIHILIFIKSAWCGVYAKKLWVWSRLRVNAGSVHLHMRVRRLGSNKLTFVWQTGE